MLRLYKHTCIWKAILLSLCCASIALAASSQRYEAFSPLLVDLEGWQGESIQGMDMTTSGMTMISATRKYVKDSATLEVNVAISGEGVGLEPAPQTFSEEGRFETPEVVVLTTSTNGFLVTANHNKKTNSGNVVVNLAAFRGGNGGAALSVSYTNLSLDEAISLTEQFNWQEMLQTAIYAL